MWKMVIRPSTNMNEFICCIFHYGCCCYFSEERFRGNRPQDSHEIFRYILECIRSEEAEVYPCTHMYACIIQMCVVFVYYTQIILCEINPV